MHLLTDSKSLFDIISKGSRTSEKLMILDIYAVRQAYKLHEISNIGFVRTNENLSDGLTIANMQGTIYNLMCTAKNEVKADKWIIRNSA